MIAKTSYETLIDACDELMAHVGRIRTHDKITPVKAWGPILDRILDTRCDLMKERDAIYFPNTKQPTKTKP